MYVIMIIDWRDEEAPEKSIRLSLLPLFLQSFDWMAGVLCMMFWQKRTVPVSALKPYQAETRKWVEFANEPAYVMKKLPTTITSFCCVTSS